MPNPVAPPSHFTSSGATTVTSLLSQSLLEPALPAHELVSLGAVYLNRRRILADAEMSEGDNLRVHPNPRRFPAETIDWEGRLIFEDADCLVVDKPAGIPVHPTCDNARENLIALLEARHGAALWICHRLDIATQGLVVLAKTRAFCHEFNQWLDGRLLKKRYRALTERELSLGELVHYMAPGDRAPHVVSKSAQDEWKACRLEIEAVCPIGQWWEAEMILGTGRHHQIRAQLAALGSPILGDDLYGSRLSPREVLKEGESIALQAFELTFPDGRRFTLPRPW